MSVFNVYLFKQTSNTEYLIFTPDRSLVFTAMEYFMSSVRKASALDPGIIVVIDMSHVSAADFTTAYVNSC
jgi:sodium-independent sulfate anion transporter 11